MKKLGLLLIILFIITVLLSQQAFCATSKDELNKEISAIETELFSTTYTKNNLKTRLSRIENDIYGTNYAKKPIEERLDKIKKDLGHTTEISQIPEKEVEPQNQIAQNKIKEQGEDDYPLVDKMELQTFGTTYKDENIYKRLDRLEQKAFGVTNKTSTLSDRVTALKIAIKLPKEKIANNSMQVYSPQNSANRNIQMPSQTRQLGKFSSNKNFDLEICALEQKLYGYDYSGQDIPTRLSKMENCLLKREYLSDDYDTRIERLGTVILAQSTAKNYEGNKMKQYISTGFQVSSVILLILGMIF